MSILKEKLVFDAWKDAWKDARRDAVKQPEDKDKGVQMHPGEDADAVKQPEDEDEAVQMHPGEDEAVQMHPDEDADARLHEINSQLSDVYKNKSKVSTELSKMITKKYSDDVSPKYKFDEETDTYTPRRDPFKDVFANLGKQVLDDNEDIKDEIADALEIDKKIYNKDKQANALKGAINTLNEAIAYYVAMRHNRSNLTQQSDYTQLDRRRIVNSDYNSAVIIKTLAAAGINMDADGFIDNATPETLTEARDRLEEQLQRLYKIKDIRIDLQADLTGYINKNFMINVKNVKMDTQKDLEDVAKPTLDAYTELITKYSEYLTPDVITKLKDDVTQLEDYMKNVGRISADKSAKKTYLDMLKKIKHNVATNYEQIMDKLNIYSNSVSAEDALLSEIKSLATYEQYTQLPPAMFENLPENIKKKCLYLMELKAKLQKQQGKNKNISQKYKINASNKPVSEDKEHAKVFNPMLNRGYSIFNKVAQHNAYNAGFL